MRIGTVVQDHRRSLIDILRALDNRITAEDNMAPAGEAGQVLMSNGENTPPTWQDIPSVAPSPSGVDGTGVAGALAVWLDADTLSDSIVTQAGSLITVGGSIGVDVDAAITGTLAVTGAVDLDSTLDVAGNTALNGSVVLGDTSSDFITGSAILARNLLPEDAVWFLGNSTHRWSQVWVSGSLILKKDALAAGFYTGITFSSVSTGVTGWSIYALNTEVGDTGYDLYIQRSDSAGDFAWLTVTRDTGAWATVGDWTQTGTVNVSGAATLQSASLSINGLAYTWPVSQATPRLLRNTGPGTLAWSLVDLSTDVTGALAVGTVPAAQVSNGTFGSGTGGGAYTFPSTLNVVGATRFGTSSGPSNNVQLWVSAIASTGTTAYGVRSDPSFPATTTSSGFAMYARLVTAASAFTLTGGYGLYVEGPSIGAGSVVTTGHGIRVAAATWTGSTTAFGVRIGDVTGASGSNYALYTDAGLVRFGDAVTTTSSLTIAGALAGVTTLTTSGAINGQTISSAANFTGTVGVTTSLTVGAAGSGVLVVPGNSEQVRIQAAAGKERDLAWYTGTSLRWTLRANASAESGSDAGSDFQLVARTDAGAFIDFPLSITRAAGGTIAFASGRPVTMGRLTAVSNVAVGNTAPVTSQLMRLAGVHEDTVSASVIGLLVAVDPVVGTTTTNNQYYAQNRVGNATLTSAIGYQVAAISIGAGTATNVYGLNVGNQGAAGVGTSYGVLVSDQSGSTTAYAMMLGRGIVRMRGQRVLLGGETVSTSAIVQVSQSEADPLIGTTQRGMMVDLAATSASTLATTGLWSRIRTAAAVFTVASGAALHVASPSLGAGSAVTTVYGLLIDDQTVGGTNYAIYTNAGQISVGDQINSRLTTGTAPFVVASTTKVANLNVDLLDDQTGSYYLDLANATGTLDETLGGTGTSTYTLGDILYASAANTLSKLAGNTTTTGMYLKQTGTGAASAAPVWDTLTAADVGAGTFPAGTFNFTGSISVNGSTLIGSAAGTIQDVLNPLRLRGTSVEIFPNGSVGATRISGDSSLGTGAHIDLYGTSHANAGRVDIASGGSAALTLTSASGQIECADDIDLASGQVLRVNGTQVVAAQGAAVADATGAGDVVAQLNALLARIRTHGLIAT